MALRVAIGWTQGAPARVRRCLAAGARPGGLAVAGAPAAARLRACSVAAAVAFTVAAAVAPDAAQAREPVAAASSDAPRARSEYILYCAGCHGFDGAPLKLGRIPPLKDSIGDFLKVEGGRAYLVQVPGVNNAGMSEEQTVRVLNWSLREFGGASMPAAFQAYTVAEVREHRARRPVDITAVRRQLLERLERIGIRKE